MPAAHSAEQARAIDVTKPALLVLASTYPRWANDTEPGFVHELSRRLTDRFRVTVLCPHANGARTTEWLDGVEVIRYRYAPERWERLVNGGGIVTNLRRHRWMTLLVPGFVGFQAWAAWRLLRARQFHVVHAHWLIPQGLVARLLGRTLARPVPFLVTSHGADLYSLRGRVLNAIKTKVAIEAGAVSVVSTAMRGAVLQMGVHSRQVHVLPMGVDLTHRFVPGDETQRSGHELLFVGRLVEKKGLRYLLHALPQVLQRFPQARLTIAGFGPDAQVLAKLADEVGISDAISFLGAVPQPELPALYRKAAAFVAPFVKAASGDQEGLPVALMEAIGCGCPIVAGYVAGLEDILGPDTAAVTVDPTHTEALAQRIVRVLEAPREERARAVQLRGRLREELDWGSIAERYGNLLETVAETASESPRAPSECNP
ncbi:glycosyltransferase [Variovorax sp.]|uniref:glycosyltransferase n=1 Tax=Variovorax sp. TaxID=1871043 RepID=UPI002D5FCF8E|nr:glycosyltransferase [Variovorax sp.]HYP82882.1 glycosyltransferase [Variovorax sp.]